MPRRASVTGDRRSRIRPSTGSQVPRPPSYRSESLLPFEAVPSIEVWPSQNHSRSTSANIRIRGRRRSPEPYASSDGDDVCGRHRLPADITKQGTQASLIGLPLADTRESPERSGPRTASSYQTDNAAVCVLQTINLTAYMKRDFPLSGGLRHAATTIGPPATRCLFTNHACALGCGASGLYCIRNMAFQCSLAGRVMGWELHDRGYEGIQIMASGRCGGIGQCCVAVGSPT